jgi:hypothetical protein
MLINSLVCKKLTSDDLNDFSYIPCQESSSRIPQVLRNQPVMELLPMVLHRWRGMWISSIPYFWPEGLETNVYPMGCQALVYTASY